MSPPPIIEIRDVRKRYDESFELALDSLDAAAGEVLCLLGPTGSGKSTLMRIIAGLEPPDSGRATFDGVAVHSGEAPLADRRRMTMLFQQAQLLSGDVRTNIEYGLRLRNRRKEDAAKVDALLVRLGLSKIASQAAATLSGGQRQLVALARALVIEPDLLLLDEPTSNLDPGRVALVEEVVSEDHARRGTTVVWTTHNLFQARRVAGRVGLLLDGRLVEEGPAPEFFDSPSDPRTADFLNGKLVY